MSFINLPVSYIGPTMIHTLPQTHCLISSKWRLIPTLSTPVNTQDSSRAYYHLGAVSIRKTVLPDMAIPMLKIRRPNGRLIFNMEIAIRR